MESLIPIYKNNDGSDVASARDLHEFLGSKQDFSDWIKKRIAKYGFTENQDYTSFHKIMERENGSTTRIEYAITIDMAKELSMVEGNAKGKQARQYFIACEKKLKEIAKPMNTLDFLQVALNQMKAHDARLMEVENKVLLIQAQTATRPDYFTIMGYAILQKVKVSLTMAAQLGRKAKSICQQNGYHVDKVRDPRFGEVGVYPTDVLKQVFDTSFS